MKKYFSSYWIRSAFYSVLQRFFLTIFGLINYVLLIRGLSKNDVGIWALFLIVTGIFEINKTALLKNAHIKFVAASGDTRERSEIASSSFLINAAITILFILFILCFSIPLSHSLKAGASLSHMLYWYIPGVLFMVFFTHLEAIQQSHLDFKGVFAGYFIRQLLFFIMIAAHWIFSIPFSLELLAIYQGISVLFGALVLYVYSRKYLEFRFNPSWAWTRKILGFGRYVFGSGVVATMFQNLDQVMIAKFTGSPSNVGYYNVAQRINTLVDVPSFAAAEVLFPKASRASAEEGKGRMKYLYERMVAILLSFTIPVSLFVILFPGFVIHVIAGTQYAAAIPIVQLYMIAGILRPAQNQAANLLNSMGKPRLCFFINTAYLVLNLILNYLFLLQFGFYGVAIGTLATFIIFALIWYFVMRRVIDLELTRVYAHAVDLLKMGTKLLNGALSKKPQARVQEVSNPETESPVSS